MCDEIKKSRNETEKSKNEIRFTCDEIHHRRNKKNTRVDFSFIRQEINNSNINHLKHQ
jgi:hypothetical protein